MMWFLLSLGALDRAFGTLSTVFVVLWLLGFVIFLVVSVNTNDSINNEFRYRTGLTAEQRKKEISDWSATFLSASTLYNTIVKYGKLVTICVVVCLGLNAFVPTMDEAVKAYVYGEASKLATADNAEKVIEGTLVRLDSIATKVGGGIGRLVDRVAGPEVVSPPTSVPTDAGTNAQ